MKSNIVERGKDYYKVKLPSGEIITRYTLPGTSPTFKTKTEEVNNPKWNRM